MDLIKEIIKKIKEDDIGDLILPNSQMPIKPMIAFRCYVALKNIKAVLDDDSLDDEDCYLNIKRIIDIFDGLGSDCSKIKIKELI